MNTINDLLENGLGDWSVTALRWINDKDFAIELLPPGTEQRVHVLFRWVQGMVINFDFGAYSGTPLIYSMTSQQGPTGLDIEIIFGGQPDGRIAFKCNDLLIDDRRKQR